MKNIFKIFISDVKRIFQNVVAVVVIMGLCVIPCLYAWFNIFSNWDPYGESSTSNLKVAVVSEDEGVTVAGISVNIGSSVVEALQENKVMGWVFTETSDEAVDGVYSGEYYAALVIPDDFTEEMISFLGGQIEHPDIIYYENERKNSDSAEDYLKSQNVCSGTGECKLREHTCGGNDAGRGCSCGKRC